MCVDFGYGVRDGFTLEYYQADDHRYYVTVRSVFNENSQVYRLGNGVGGFILFADEVHSSPRFVYRVAARHVPAKYRAWARTAAAAFCDTAHQVNAG